MCSFPSLPPFSVVNDVLQSRTVFGSEEEKARKVAKHDFIRFDFKLNKVSRVSWIFFFSLQIKGVQRAWFANDW